MSSAKASSALTSVLERVEDELAHPHRAYRDMLLERYIKKVFNGLYISHVDGRSLPVPKAKCKIVGRDIYLRPTDETRFLYECKKYGIDTHPEVAEMNRRFSRDPDYYVRFTH